VLDASNCGLGRKKGAALFTDLVFSLGWPIFRCGGHLDLVGAEIC